MRTRLCLDKNLNKKICFLFIAVSLSSQICMAIDWLGRCDEYLRFPPTRYYFPPITPWDNISSVERLGLHQKDFRLGLPSETEFQGTFEFGKSSWVDQQASYQEAWIMLTNASGTMDLLTHRIEMPTGFLFYRILDDEVFGRLGVTYLGEDGLLWSAPFEETMSWTRAQKKCGDLGARLPTREEYEGLIGRLGRTSYGVLNSLLPSPSRYESCWCSSVNTEDSNVADYFVEKIGAFGSNPKNIYDASGARCVRSP